MMTRIESKFTLFKTEIIPVCNLFATKLIELRTTINLPLAGITGILILLIAFLSSVCSISTKSSTTSLSRSKQNAPYNRPYKVGGKTYYPISSAVGYREKGIASWYGKESGNRTAMGTRFNPQGLTAAHRTLPLPTKVRVTNLRNGRAVDVIVNDRGPFKRNRLIDLSHGAAKKIGLHGLTEVRVEYLENMANNP
jgi:rare lipoprotein A